LRIRIPLEIVKANPMTAGANQLVECAERLDGDVLKDE
jgi:hypothetical protein